MKRCRGSRELVVPFQSALGLVADFLTPRDIQLLRSVSSEHHTLLRQHLSRRILHDLDAVLHELQTPLPRPWPADVYLSGSVLFKVLTGGTWRPNDVDLMVPNDRTIIHATQRWLVSLGYRIMGCMDADCGYGHTSSHVYGSIAWSFEPQHPITTESQRHDPHQWRSYCELYQLDVTDDAGIPRASTRNGQLQMILVNTQRQTQWSQRDFLSQLLAFDFPVLENTFDGQTVTVLAPEDVRTNTTMARCHDRCGFCHNQPCSYYKKRCAERTERYQQRGLVILNPPNATTPVVSPPLTFAKLIRLR